MPKTRGAVRRTSGPARRTAPRQAAAPDLDGLAPDVFYRDLVWNLRNGVVAVTRDGRVAVMNEVAYRILGLKPRSTDIGQPTSGRRRNSARSPLQERDGSSTSSSTV